MLIAAIAVVKPELMLLEMAAMHAEHGAGKGKRLQINYAKRALVHMAEQEEDPALKQRLGQAKLSRQWMSDARARVDAAAGGGDGGMCEYVSASVAMETCANSI